MTLDQFAAVAVPIAKSKGYPPELLIAQWAIESGWGKKVSGDNNYFGMTRAKRHGENWRWVPTREVLKNLDSLDQEERATITSQSLRPDGKWDVRLSRRFASYPTVEDAINDKIALIMSGPPYQKLFKAYQADRDLDKFIDAFSPVYATDPGYAKLVKQIISQGNVQSSIKNIGQ